MNKHLASKSASATRPGLRRPVRRASPRPNRYHTFLKRLSAGGRSNMYGAIPYLMRAFELDRETAFRILCEWLDEQEAALAPAANTASPTR